MHLIKHDVNLGRAAFWNVKNSLPFSLTTIEWEDTFVSVFSEDNPQLLFWICGFKVHILSKIRTTGGEQFLLKDAMWNLINEQMIQRKRELRRRSSAFRRQCPTIQQPYSLSPHEFWLHKFLKDYLIGLMMYYHEAIVHTNELLDSLVKAKNKIQTCVKIGLNSKMPSHFPPVVFYTPKELGGLGMLLMGHVLILQCNLQWFKQIDVGGSSVLFFDIPSFLTLVCLNSTHFCACMTHEEDQRPDDENHNTLLLFPKVMHSSGSNAPTSLMALAQQDGDLQTEDRSILPWSIGMGAKRHI